MSHRVLEKAIKVQEVSIKEYIFFFVNNYNSLHKNYIKKLRTFE